MTEKFDEKFYGEVRKVKDDSVVPDDQWMVFLAKDNAFAQTLPFYRHRCKVLGADAEQLAAVDRTIARMTAWRAANMEKLKVPDAKGEKLLRGGRAVHELQVPDDEEPE
jgi:hypothetical protein